jgi:hypothetical protein
LKRVHIGHHFYGAGNLGDDFMLAGFLQALGAARSAVALTCCTPHARDPLARRFPGVSWLPADEGTRRACIETCDAWLGLGGTPFQSNVSNWFSEHLKSERRLCAAAGKPMFFLGVGGQDEGAYRNPGLRAAAAQAERIWTRDQATADALLPIAPGRVRAAADLAHVFFAACPPPPAANGRFTAVLNADYAGWDGLPSFLAALHSLPARERIWLAQEHRPLPGAERRLLEGLPRVERDRWRLLEADRPGEPLASVLSRWPSGEWLLASRYHATLAGAWAGSKAVVVAINDKLRSAALECGYPAIDSDADPRSLEPALRSSLPPKREALEDRAAAARRACHEFAEAAGLAAT